MATSQNLKRDNIVYDSSGQPYIPGSQRPDGSWRKPIRVKEGYIPPDEMPVYQSRAKREAAEMPKLPAGPSISLLKFLFFVLGLDYADEGLMGCLTSDHTPSGLTKNQKKSARRRQKKKDKKEPSAAFEIEEVIDGLETVTVSEDTPITAPSTAAQDPTPPSSTSVDKQVKALRKKLKQVEELEQKRKSGVKLDPDQIKKIKRREEFEEELRQLTKDDA